MIGGLSRGGIRMGAVPRPRSSVGATASPIWDSNFVSVTHRAVGCSGRSESGRQSDANQPLPGEYCRYSDSIVPIKEWGRRTRQIRFDRS